MKLSIVYRSVSALTPYAANARTHTDLQVAQIAKSIENLGFNNPILITGAGVIIAGEGRYMAARKLGLAEVPTIELAELSEAQAAALRLADNKIALNSGWDVELLRSELAGLDAMDEPIDNLGFTDGELEKLLDDQAGLRVVEVSTGPVNDRFWISIRGPLAQQAQALSQLTEVMKALPGVEVELGTIALET
jgi:ParB-like chromosome segregation protein Spo0J